jgi:hypothetical protein
MQDDLVAANGGYELPGACRSGAAAGGTRRHDECGSDDEEHSSP